MLAILVTGIAALLVAAPQFEVASVKKLSPNVAAPGTKSLDPNRSAGGSPLQIDQGRFTYTNTLFSFILRAYGIPGCGAPDCGLVAGGERQP